MLTTQSLATVALVAFSGTGCKLDREPDPVPEPTEPLASAVGTHSLVTPGDVVVQDAGQAVGDLTGLPGAGWVNAAGSLIEPYCSAVRLDATHAVTGEACAPSTLEMAFGHGPVGQDGVDVVAAERTLAPGLRLLELAESSAEAPAAEGFAYVDIPASTLAGKRVQVQAYLFTEPGEPTQRWLWEGTLDAASDGSLQVVPDFADGGSDAPNCHGDNGAGVFTEDGDLVGIIVSASGHSDAGCAERFGLARPAPEER